MADSTILIPSAVVLPEESSENVTNSLKRRASEEDHVEIDSKKRARTDTSSHDDSVGNDGSALKPSNYNIPAKNARRPEDEEQRRGKRMFGALLGVLGGGPPGGGRSRARQKGANSDQAAKKRQELEKRAQEKLKRVYSDPIPMTKEQLQHIERLRWRRQREVDEDTMKTRHAHMLLSARFLRTSTEPKLFYKPYQLSMEEEAQVQRQIQDARDEIEEEVLEFEENRRNLPSLEQESERRPKQGTNAEEPNSVKPEPPDVSTETNTNLKHDATDSNNDNVVASSKAISSSATDVNPDELHHGETFVEGEEDTVIY